MVVSFFREIIFRSQKTNKTSVFYSFVKILNVRILETPVIYVVEPYLDIWSAKCQVNISFSEAYSPEIISVNDFIFSNFNFEHFWTSPKNKNENFVIMRSNWLRKTHF